MDPYLKEAFDRARGLGQRGPLVLGGSISAILVIAFIDQMTGTHISLAVLYVVPAAVMSWYLGRPGGHSAALLAGLAELTADLTTTATIDPLTIAWNALSITVIAWIVAEVLTRLHRALDAERSLARTDALTGTANSRSFTEAAEIELERVQRYGGIFTVAYLDLDHFKLVNDTLGHDAGDRLLRDVARTLDANLRRIDVVARLGGDEFVILLPETGRQEACVALEHVREGLAGLSKVYGAGVKASIGCVTFIEPPPDLDEMLRQADAAMYSAKYSGRDRVVSLTIPEPEEVPASA
ncbi:MAG: GGDEF domain-containing protein [Coriobacteriia bacterium]|nr:GGDEF domain-containing protein [Coriobacteriia bacterium]